MSNGELWEPGLRGVLQLPSGRLVRGRGLRRPPAPEDAAVAIGAEGNVGATTVGAVSSRIGAAGQASGDVAAAVGTGSGVTAAGEMTHGVAAPEAVSSTTTGGGGAGSPDGRPGGQDGSEGKRVGAVDGRDSAPRAHLSPDFGLYLLGTQPPEFTWTARWVRWPDFRLPSDRADALDAIVEAWTRAEYERVEVACGGGHGRTGTALACMAVLDGVDPREAVAYVRAHYDAHAVETPWQRRYVRKFPARTGSGGSAA